MNSITFHVLHHFLKHYFLELLPHLHYLLLQVLFLLLKIHLSEFGALQDLLFEFYYSFFFFNLDLSYKIPIALFSRRALILNKALKILCLNFIVIVLLCFSVILILAWSNWIGSININVLVLRRLFVIILLSGLLSESVFWKRRAWNNFPLSIMSQETHIIINCWVSIIFSVIAKIRIYLRILLLWICLISCFHSWTLVIQGGFLYLLELPKFFLIDMVLLYELIKVIWV